MASSSSSSGDRLGAAEVRANAARASADKMRTRATAVEKAAEAVGPEADPWNKVMGDVVAAHDARAKALENDTAWVSADHRSVQLRVEGQAKPPALDWLELSHQNELQRFYRTNPGDAPPIIPGRPYYLLAPGVHPMEDLANPGRPLVQGTASYGVIE